LPPANTSLQNSTSQDSADFQKLPANDSPRSIRRELPRALARTIGFFDLSTTASAASPGHPWDAPSPRPSAVPRSNSPSTPNTTLPDGPHHRSTSAGDYAANPP